MITFNELLERTKNEEIVVHTPTKAQAIALLEALDEAGYEWCDGEKLTAQTNYEDYKENTCYVFSRDYYGDFHHKRVFYNSLEFQQEMGYIIVECGDIDFKEE